MDFHYFSLIFIEFVHWFSLIFFDVHRFSSIFIDCLWFSWISLIFAAPRIQRTGSREGKRILRGPYYQLSNISAINYYSYQAINLATIITMITYLLSTITAIKLSTFSKRFAAWRPLASRGRRIYAFVCVCKSLCFSLLFENMWWRTEIIFPAVLYGFHPCQCSPDLWLSIQQLLACVALASAHLSLSPWQHQHAHINHQRITSWTQGPDTNENFQLDPGSGNQKESPVRPKVRASIRIAS